MQRNTHLKNVTIDRGCTIPDGSVIRFDQEADKAARFRISNGGVVIATRSMLGQSRGYA